MSSESPRTCTTKKCHNRLLPITTYKWSTCEKCQNLDWERKQKKRARENIQKREREEDEHPPSRDSSHLSPQHLHRDGAEGDDDNGLYKRYPDAETLFMELRKHAKQIHVEFAAEYTMPLDLVVSDKAQVQMIQSEVWKITGYRFTVHEHRQMETGHKTLFWCSQDAEQKKNSRKREDEHVQNRDTVGMRRFPCQSKLTITSKNLNKYDESIKLVSIHIRHHHKHVPYYDVSMPEEAAEIIRDNIITST
ncbi:hypothetical protein F5890DRAFT_1422608, partial [Lentinula detonsa]